MTHESPDEVLSKWRQLEKTWYEDEKKCRDQLTRFGPFYVVRVVCGDADYHIAAFTCDENATAFGERFCQKARSTKLIKDPIFDIYKTPSIMDTTSILCGVDNMDIDNALKAIKKRNRDP
jgi:hypothetical protein